MQPDSARLGPWPSALGRPCSDVGETRGIGGSGAAAAGEREGRGVFFLVGGVEVGELCRDGIDFASGLSSEVNASKFAGTQK